jgi:hypothetical protein
MPGLLRGVARTAAVAGTATVVSGRVQRRQAEKYAARDADIAANRGAGYAQGAQTVAYEQAPPPPPAPAAPATDTISQLKQLAELKQQGILTDEEFTQAKARILG